MSSVKAGCPMIAASANAMKAAKMNEDRGHLGLLPSVRIGRPDQPVCKWNASVLPN